MFGNNVKIHFAGADSVPFCAMLGAADVQYNLFSCYSYLVKNNKNFETDHMKVVSGLAKHTIMDSGLFTLMFGAKAGETIDKKFLENWMYKHAELVTVNDLPFSCVEIDCQKVLSVKDAWYFRQKMREILPAKNRLINVFHMEDGRIGLDRLIEYSEYIAISVPELRIHRPKDYIELSIRLAHYIKNKKPSIDIHMLGCTQESIIKHINFCTSADSTSWIAPLKFGRIESRSTHNMNHDKIREKYRTKYHLILDTYGVKDTYNCEKDYYYRGILSADIHKRKYEKWVGDQE